MNYVDFNFKWLIDKMLKMDSKELFEHIKNRYLQLTIETFFNDYGIK